MMTRSFQDQKPGHVIPAGDDTIEVLRALVKTSDGCLLTL